MGKKEALIDLLKQAAEYCLPSNTEKSHIEMLADFLYDYVEVVRIRVPKGEKQAAWRITGDSLIGPYKLQCTNCKSKMMWLSCFEFPDRCKSCGAYITDLRFGEEE